MIERDPTKAEQKLYGEVMEAVLDTLDSFAEHPLVAKRHEVSILIDGTLAAVAAVIAGAHAGHQPDNCTCEANAIRSLRYAIANAFNEPGELLPYAQH